jgi:AraC-like DNA-binding protein
MLRPIKIRYYVEMMGERGYPARSVLEGTGIDLKRLADPAYLVDLHQCTAVVSNMIRLTGDQAIGFEMGRKVKLADWGIIAHAMISSRTLRQAIGYWLTYANLVGMLIRLTLIVEPRKEWTVVFAATEPMGFIYNFCVEEILMAGTRLGSQLVGAPLDVREVRLSYPAPLHAAHYRRYFDCPIHFNAARSSITVRGPSIDTVLPSNDAELNEVYRRHCSRVLREIGSGNPLEARLRNLFLLAKGAVPDLAASARELGLSTRTLRRHLADEGTSYQKLANQVRFDLAMEYLRADHLSSKEVGDLLGFKDTNAFRRAFKTWSGKTIQEFRTNS